MPSLVTDTPQIPLEDLESFSEHLKSSTRILALLGAGLSASSGLPTFRGAGGYWRTYEATQLATPQAFQNDPGLVWQFYSYRRHMALRAQPNRAHLALAELARKKPEFLTISQNVDGLSQRAGHPASNLELLHGSLFDIKCPNFYCDFSEQNNFVDPIVPALALPHQQPGLDNTEAETSALEHDISNAEVPLKEINPADLPHCPKCQRSLLRPGVVWFGESLPSRTLSRVDSWMADRRGVDLILVIGTSARVWPAAGYIEDARARGARVAVINTETPDEGASRLKDDDWFFQGDAGEIVPQILEAVTGRVSAQRL